MEALRHHLELRNPRFACRDVSEKHGLIVPLESTVGAPATEEELAELRMLAGDEYASLELLYRSFNGVYLHGDGETFGLVVARVQDLSRMAQDWRESFHVDENELYDFQREGVPFATIFESGNYFVCHRGKVYYSNHDGGDDAVWGGDIDAFFRRALMDPAKFLLEAGCYTRYSDGHTDRQFIPEAFEHD